MKTIDFSQMKRRCFYTTTGLKDGVLLSEVGSFLDIHLNPKLSTLSLFNDIKKVSDTSVILKSDNANGGEIQHVNWNILLSFNN